MAGNQIEKTIDKEKVANREVVKDLLFVINPISGGVDKADLSGHINTFCEANEFRPIIYETTNAEDAKNIKELFKKHQPKAVIAVGGDGTINLVGEILIGHDIPLGIIPKGSANGLAKELDIPADEDEAFDVIRNFNPRAIDTLVINKKRAFHLSDVGFNAHIIKRFNKSSKRGFVNYTRYFIRDFFRYRFSHYRIETPDGNYDGKAFMVIITNARRFGTDVTINPNGQIDDGKMEIGILKKFPKLQFFRIAYRLLNNTIDRSVFYEIIKTDRALIRNTERRSFHIDGEPVRPVEKIEVRVDSRSLKILVP